MGRKDGLVKMFALRISSNISTVYSNTPITLKIKTVENSMKGSSYRNTEKNLTT